MISTRQTELYHTSDNRYKHRSVSTCEVKDNLKEERRFLLECLPGKFVDEGQTNQELYDLIPIPRRPYLIESINHSLPTVYKILREEGHVPSLGYHLNLALKQGYLPILVDILSYYGYPKLNRSQTVILLGKRINYYRKMEIEKYCPFISFDIEYTE